MDNCRVTGRNAAPRLEAALSCGGGLPDWVVLDVASGTKVDPNSVENGTPTMDGDYAQVPVSSNVNYEDGNSALLYHFEIPTGWVEPVLGVEQTLLQVEIDFATEPTGSYGVGVGYYDPMQPTCIAAGIRHKTVSGMQAAVAFRWNGGAASDDSVESNTALVFVSLAGVLDGVQPAMGTATAQVTTPTGAGTAYAAYNGTGTVIDASTLRLAAFILHGSASLEAETLDFRVRYRFIPVA